MKKILLMMLTVACAFGARATHLMGGDITVKQDSAGYFTLKLSLYRDTSGIPLGTSETVDIYVYNTTSSSYVHTGAMSIPRNIALSTTLLPSFPYGVEVGIYTASGYALSPGQYRFVYSTCCRNGAILNASNPLSESMGLYTDFTVSASNSTPACLSMPVAYFPENLPATYNPLPYDVDGDSLSWSLNTPIGNVVLVSPPTFTSVAGFTAPPAAAGGAFTMNSVTGEITWTPNAVGNYIQSFQINEYRGGVQIGSIIRDMQYVVVAADTTTVPAFQMVSPYQTNTTGEEYNYVYYDPGQPFTFQIAGMNMGASGTLLMESYCSLYQQTVNPATFTTANGSNTVTGTLHWTPAANFTSDVTAVFRLRQGMFTKDFTVVMRKNPNPNSVPTVTSGVKSMKVFPNPAKGSVNISMELASDLNGGIFVYNSLGQMVHVIYEGKLAKGTYNMQDNLNLAAGVYQVVVKGEGKTMQTQALVLQ
ncbi:T9SS type A sorting domain-containing protein [Chitinophagaceae bacterium MMS25-I14]